MLHLQRKPGRNYTRALSVLSLNYLSWAGRTDKRTHLYTPRDGTGDNLMISQNRREVQITPG